MLILSTSPYLIVIKYSMNFINRMSKYVSIQPHLPRCDKKSTFKPNQELGKKRWIHAFPKNINTKGNAKSFVQDLNSFSMPQKC